MTSLLNNNNLLNNGMLTNKKNTQRYKLITEGDLQICKLQHSKHMFGKLLNSKLLRRWKSQRIMLTGSEISSTSVNRNKKINLLWMIKTINIMLIVHFFVQKSDVMDSSIPYHTILELYSISKWEPGQKYCLRIVTNDGQYLIQVCFNER